MIDIAAIIQRVFDAAVVGLGEGAVVVETRAKQKAPVRRLFSDGGSTIVPKTATAIEADRSLRIQLGLGPERSRGPHQARTTVGASPPRHWRERGFTAANALLAQYDAEMASRKAGNVPVKTMLTRHGASEVRSKRAAFSTWQHLKVGGRLRGEIYATGPSVSGGRAEAWVISPTPYAKYMEFGTRHAAAHPFLRPALAESQGDIVSRISAAVKAASRTQGSDTVIDIVVHL